jgi:hypothetical protein
MKSHKIGQKSSLVSKNSIADRKLKFIPYLGTYTIVTFSGGAFFQELMSFITHVSISSVHGLMSACIGGEERVDRRNLKATSDLQGDSKSGDAAHARCGKTAADLRAAIEGEALPHKT